MENVYLARQPILDIQGKQYSYDILYLDSHKQSHIENDLYASASVVSSVLNKFGTSAFVSGHKAFVKIDEKFLMNDLIFVVPNNFFIFSLFDIIEMSEKVIERIEQLKEKGYTLAINDTNLDASKFEKYKPILKELSYFKTNIHSDMGNETKELISKLKANGIKVVATKIEDDTHYEIAKKIGCELFQGYYFAKPKILENAKYDTAMFNVLKLYNLLIQDTNIDEIVSEFEKNHALTIQLLRFINSGAFHFKSKIASIHHVLTLVGRKPLAQWLMLMIYSKSTSSSVEASPLMLMVKNRTELMENLLKAIKPDVKSNALGEAYFVGVLSLIDAIFGVKLEEILETMNVSDLVRSALLHDEGTLGKIYAVVRDIEAFNVNAIAEFTTKYKLATEDIQRVVMESIENVNNFQREMKG
ncbi:MAG: EAL domain-containing protein [Sulfurimonas sp.]|jgi:EAL and modified HD-GYP domain-containing signal transduction protein